MNSEFGVNDRYLIYEIICGQKIFVIFVHSEVITFTYLFKSGEVRFDVTGANDSIGSWTNTQGVIIVQLKSIVNSFDTIM